MDSDGNGRVRGEEEVREGGGAKEGMIQNLFSQKRVSLKEIGVLRN